MTDSAVVWEDPPEGPGRGPHFRLPDSVRAALIANPNQWALIHTYKSRSAAVSMATRINQDKSPFFAADMWEARGSRPASGGSKLYLRYTGGR